MTPTVGLAALAAVLMVAPNAATATTGSPRGRYCAVAMTRVGERPATTPIHCFGTAAAMAAFVSGGRYRPRADADPDRVVAMLALRSGPRTSVIGVGKDTDWIDEQYVFYADNTSGCTTGYSYSLGAMPSGWNDKLDALDTSTGCVATVYENENFNIDHPGATRDCPCATLGVLEDEVSSVKFYPASSAEIDLGILESLLDLVDQNVLSQLDPTICAVLITLAPIANGLGAGVYVDSTGDVYVGDGQAYDCPPYVTA